MTKKIFSTLFFSVFLVISNCQKNNNKNITMNNKSTINNNDKLIDGIIIDNSIFKKDDIDLKKYKYKNSYIEDLKINDFLDKDYREEFIKYLKETKTEDDEFKSTLISQLLFIRMAQLSDSNAFYLLSEFSKDDLISYNGIELYPERMVKFFIEKPLFLIQQGAKYQDTTLLNFINQHLDEFLVKESFFSDNLGEINLQSGQLFIFPEKESEFDESFREKLSKFNSEECIFSPSLYTAWQNKTINFTDISPLFGESLISKLNVFEKNYFNQNVIPTLKKYIIIGHKESLTATIQDPDGYTNLRKDKNTTSEILQRINSGEHIEVLDNSGDWYLIKTKQGKQGYVHRSRVKSN